MSDRLRACQISGGFASRRLGYSPDDADAFALTFAQPVAARGGMTGGGRPGRVRVDYDPLKWA